jgi:chromosome segregation ATPase
MKKIILTIFSLALASSFNCAYAKSDTAVDSGAQNTIQANEEHREQVKATIKSSLLRIKSEWKEKRTEILGKIKAEKEELKNKFQEKFTDEKCNRVQARIENRNGFFKGNYEKHTSVYANLVDRINKFIAKADDVKLDTATIKSHLATLQDKIEKFKDDYAAYKAKFDETKNVTCGHSEGEFKGVLLESKELLKTVHTDAADIRTYVRETILVDMQALKSQMPAEASVD